MTVNDVLIGGAGPAGLALACALADAGLRVTVLEQQPLQALESPADDGREIALTHPSRRLLERLGLWRHLPGDDVSPLRAACVLDGDDPRPLRFDAPASLGDEPLGWLVPNHRLRAAALAAVRQRADRIALETDARVSSLEVLADRVVVTRGDDGRRHEAALLVAADSRFSSLRRLAGIGATMRDFGRSAIVAPLDVERAHEGTAWECFRYGHTLALLPMTGRRVSAVVTVRSDEVPRWLALSDEAFAAEVESCSGGRLGAMRAAGARHHYPLVGVEAMRFTAPRVALAGDAAVGMHPVTAHGYNLGLHGVEALARELAAARSRGADAGDPDALRAYERAHRRATAPLYHGTNALVTLFTDDRPLPRLARHAVLDLSQRAPLVSGWVKAFVTRQLVGARAR